MSAALQTSIDAMVRLLIYGLGTDYERMLDVAETIDGGVVATVTTKDGQRLRISVRRES